MPMDGSNRLAWGRGLLSGGYVLLATGFGMGIGYWAADWQIRWLPSMVGNIFILWTFAFITLAWGAQLRAGRRDDRGLRRRAVGFGALALLSIVGLSLVMLASRRTPLTAMSETEYRYGHELDAKYFRDLDRNLRGLVALLENQDGLFNETPARTLTPEEERLVLDSWTSYLDTAFALDRIRRFHEDFYGFDLSRMERVRHVRSFLLSFAAELSLYENTTRMIELFDGNENVVRFLNVEREMPSLQRDSVALVREELAGLTDLSRIAAGKNYLSYLDRVHQGKSDAVAERFDWLWNVVTRYVAAVEKRRRREMVTMSASSDFAPILRGIKHLSFPVQKSVAEWMGDVRVKRVGKYLVTAEQARIMQDLLSPGDVLLSRKNWYLSNIGLPGFWPHAILYVGTTRQLESAFDDDPDINAWVREQTGEEQSFTEFLASTYPLAWRQRELTPADAQALSVIEAVSEGVTQNSLYTASGDFIVGLRPRLPSLVKALAVVKAFSFLERPYDFDFDFATDHALVCTEVVWRSYRPEEGRPGLRLDPVRVGGRLTLPANDIASLFKKEFGQPGAQFDFVYYLEGKEAELIATTEDVHSFLKTPERSKWDLDL